MINNLFSSLIQTGCNNLDCKKIIKIIENFKPLSKNLQNKIYTGLLSNIQAQILINQNKYDEALNCVNESIQFYEQNKFFENEQGNNDVESNKKVYVSNRLYEINILKKLNSNKKIIESKKMYIKSFHQNNIKQQFQEIQSQQEIISVEKTSNLIKDNFQTQNSKNSIPEKKSCNKDIDQRKSFVLTKRKSKIRIKTSKLSNRKLLLSMNSQQEKQQNKGNLSFRLRSGSKKSEQSKKFSNLLNQNLIQRLKQKLQKELENEERELSKVQQYFVKKDNKKKYFSQTQQIISQKKLQKFQKKSQIQKIIRKSQKNNLDDNQKKDKSVNLFKKLKDQLRFQENEYKNSQRSKIIVQSESNQKGSNYYYIQYTRKKINIELFQNQKAVLKKIYNIEDIQSFFVDEFIQNLVPQYLNAKKFESLEILIQNYLSKFLNYNIERQEIFINKIPHSLFGDLLIKTSKQNFIVQFVHISDMIFRLLVYKKQKKGENIQFVTFVGVHFTIDDLKKYFCLDQNFVQFKSNEAQHKQIIQKLKLNQSTKTVFVQLLSNFLRICLENINQSTDIIQNYYNIFIKELQSQEFKILKFCINQNKKQIKVFIIEKQKQTEISTNQEKIKQFLPNYESLNKEEQDFINEIKMMLLIFNIQEKTWEYKKPKIISQKIVFKKLLYTFPVQIYFLKIRSKYYILIKFIDLDTIQQKLIYLMVQDTSQHYFYQTENRSQIKQKLKNAFIDFDWQNYIDQYICQQHMEGNKFCNSLFKQIKLINQFRFIPPNIMKEINNLDFLYRIQKTQQLIKNENMDCLLLINGSDGLNNQQNTIFMNWIFGANSGFEIIKSTYLQKYFDESIFVIKQQSVECFVSEESFFTHQELFMSLKFKSIHTYTFEQITHNRDEFEREKSLFFFKSVLELKNVAVLLDINQDIQNIRDIEKWPLIKVFAIQQLEQGFFTMSKNVLGFEEKVQQLYNEIDQPYLNLILQQTQVLGNNYQLVKNLINGWHQDQQHELQAQKLQEPLQEVYSIGKISNKKSFGNFIDKEPYVQIGQKKNQLKDPLHMTIHDTCPYTNVMYFRTYLLTQNNSYSYYPLPTKNDEGYVVDYQLQKRKDNNFQDEYRISTYYLKMIQFYFKLLEKLKQGSLNKSSVQNFQNLLQQKICDVDQNIQVKVEDSVLKMDFVYYDSFLNEYNLMEYLDKQNNDFNVSQFLDQKYLFTIKLSINNLKSCQDQNKVLGDIVLGDSFYLYNKNLINFTDNISYFDFFSCEKKDEYSIRNMKELYATKFLGQRILDKCDDIQLYIPLKESILKFQIQMNFEKVQLTWFEKGFKVISDKIGDFLILFNEFVKEYYQYREDENCYLILELNNPLFFKKFSQNYLIFRFQKNAMYDLFFKFLDNNKEKQIKQIDCFDKFFKNDNQIFDNQQNLKKFKILYQQYVGEGFDQESFQYEKFRYNNINVKYNQKDKEFILFVGNQSNKQNTIDFLHQNLQKQQRRNVFKYQHNYYQLNDLCFETFIECFEEYIQNKKGLFLINIPFFINLKDIIDYFKQKNLHIKSVASCIDYVVAKSNNFSGYFVDQYLQSGYINVCLIQIQKEQDDWQNDVNKLQNSFEQIQFVVCKQDRLIGQDLMCLIEEKFNTRQNQIQRQLKPYSHYHTEQKFINFNAPIYRQQLIKLQDTLKRNQGIFLDYQVTTDSEKGLTEIEKQINEFLQVANPYIQYKKRQAIKIHCIQGFFTFQEEYDKIYFVKLTKNKIQQQLVYDNLQVENIQVNNTNYQKIFYPEEIKKSMKILIDYEGHCGVKNLNYLIQILLDRQNQFIEKKLKLTQEQIEQILQNQAEEGLENGDIYDGYVWRNQFGKVYKTHPNKQQILKNFIDANIRAQKEQYDKQQQKIEEYIKTYEGFLQ